MVWTVRAVWAVRTVLAVLRLAEKGSQIRRTALEADAFAGPVLRVQRGLFAPGGLWDGG